MKIKWPGNDEVRVWKSGISEIDNMDDFNYYFRAALIAHEITIDDYLKIEQARDQYQKIYESLQGKVSQLAINIFIEVIANK